ncbi:MAG TPA: outer membrane beta-barrel protein [Ferruginibacter sp.]|nr:outer membrane beta-barrel protein [Ferruginibacter sp.]
MKRLTLLLATVIFCISASAQTDTTYLPQKSDTMRIGNIIIIKRGGKGKGSREIKVGNAENQPKKHSRITTNWGIVDIGFANYSDQTNYANTGNYLVNRPGAQAFGKDDFKLRTGKSINVNIWFFMQRLSLIKQNVNLKYGLGLELNNYRYKSNISYKENGVIPYSNGVQTSGAFIFRDSIGFTKNKLAADYLTIPVMLNFAANHPNSKNGFSVSFGVSAGYLYSQRNKQRSGERGKERNKGDYDLEKFKFSYVAELGLGPVKLYGSYTPKSIYEHSLDIRPFNFGFRLSN